MREYLALPDGAGRFPQDFSGPVVLRDTAEPVALHLQGYHLLWRYFPGSFDFGVWSRLQALQPRCRLNDIGLGYSPFARHYLGNHCCFLFLRVLRCFSSPGSLSLRSDRSSTCRVSPFGNLRINACLQLPVAYRSLPRPSSPSHAKASTMRSYLLKPNFFTGTYSGASRPLVRSFRNTPGQPPCDSYLSEVRIVSYPAQNNTTMSKNSTPIYTDRSEWS